VKGAAVSEEGAEPLTGCAKGRVTLKPCEKASPATRLAGRTTSQGSAVSGLAQTKSTRSCEAATLEWSRRATGFSIDERGTAVCLSQLNARPVGARSSPRRLISLQIDVGGHVLVNGLNDRRRRTLADGIQDVSERLGQSFGPPHCQPLL
jgi:hypothetical protein